MESIERQLITEARKKHGWILPCGASRGFSSCFTRFNGALIFWFNTRDGSSHIEIADKIAKDQPPVAARDCY